MHKNLLGYSRIEIQEQNGIPTASSRTRQNSTGRKALHRTFLAAIYLIWMLELYRTSNSSDTQATFRMPLRTQALFSGVLSGLLSAL
ncbi:MAG: hypothetical protein WA804_09925, partial [Terriglobales bacterium]